MTEVMIDRVDSRNFNYDEGRKTLEIEVVVFTGRGFTVRWELAQFARNCRAKVESTVTSRTTLLIVGEKPGGKLIKAKKMGCKIISCDEFYNILMGIDEEYDINEIDFSLDILNIQQELMNIERDGDVHQ